MDELKNKKPNKTDANLTDELWDFTCKQKRYEPKKLNQILN